MVNLAATGLILRARQARRAPKGRQVPSLLLRVHGEDLRVVRHGTVRSEIYEVPKGVHPVAKIAFPPGRPNGKPIRLRVKLGQRCWGFLFHGPVRVPKEAGKGAARVTLWFPDWKQGRVEPVTIEVPTVDPARSEGKSLPLAAQAPKGKSKK